MTNEQLGILLSEKAARLAAIIEEADNDLYSRVGTTAKSLFGTEIRFVPELEDLRKFQREMEEQAETLMEHRKD